MAVTRTIFRALGFDLSLTGNSVRFSVPTGKAVRVDCQKGIGWAAATLEVKFVAGNEFRSFASAKTIAAGGASVQMSVDEMRGVTELVVVMTSALESASLANIFATVEEEDGR